MHSLHAMCEFCPETPRLCAILGVHKNVHEPAIVSRKNAIRGYISILFFHAQSAKL